MKLLHSFNIFLLFLLLLTACSGQGVKTNPPIKNIILLIGDGMGPQQLGLLREYARRAEHSIYREQKGLTAFDHFAAEGFVGLSSHGPADTLVVDSACSASQLASGVFSNSEMIGLDQYGNPVETILEKAKKLGKATGLVSDTRISHATPAAFAAHQRHRSMENEIAMEMLSSNNVDVMLSGGLRHWLPASINSDESLRRKMQKRIGVPELTISSRRNDDLDLLSHAEQQGYQLVFNRQQLQMVRAQRLIGLFATSAMQDAVTYHRGEQQNQPSLAEMAIKAFDILAQNPRGFFLMVEGGQIDWAGHNNDAGTLLHEMIRFEEAISAIYEKVKTRRDTLVIITADHETGGFGFSYSRYDLPKAKTLPGKMFKGHQYQPNFNYASPTILDRLHAQKKSFTRIWQQAAHETKLPTAESLIKAINENSDFKIGLSEANEILQTETNQLQHAGHPYLNSHYFPRVHDFKEFYVYGNNVYLDLIGRALAKEQNVVWATGTHTHTPVPVIAWGPEQHSRRFSTLSHHTDVGRWMIELIEND